MARGGFISTSAAINKVFSIAPSRDNAMQLIADHLISGEIETRGRKLLGREEEPSIGDGLVLRDLAAASRGRPILGAAERMRPAFWTKVDFSETTDLDWENGRFTAETSDQLVQFFDVRLKETDINALIVKHQPPEAHPSPKPRRKRNAGWEDWIAALAILAHQGRIDGHMDLTALLNLITDQLQEWGFEEMPEPTVSPTARAVLDRFRSHPPS